MLPSSSSSVARACRPDVPKLRSEVIDPARQRRKVE
jgi:hypothetical protein